MRPCASCFKKQRSRRERRCFRRARCDPAAGARGVFDAGCFIAPELQVPRTSKMCVVVAARRHPLHKCAMMQPRGCGSRDVPRKCPVQTRVRADVRRSFGWGRVVVRVVCAMCARAVSERGAKRRSPPLRHPHTVFLPVSTLQAVAESSVGCLHGWRCVVTARCLLALAASGGGSVVVCRLKANTYTHRALVLGNKDGRCLKQRRQA